MSALRSIAAASLTLLLLAACSREAPTPPLTEQEDTQVEAPEPAPAPPPVVEAPPPPPPAVIEENFEEPAPEPIDPSEQTLEDADATGLTTRALPRSEDEEAPADGGSGADNND